MCIQNIQKNNLKTISNTMINWAKYLNKHLTKEDIQMANKYMTSSVIGELKIKTMNYHYVLTIKSKIQNLTMPNADKAVEQKKLIHCC